jgi:hypothetical protein
MFSSFTSFQLTLLGDVAIFVATLVFGTKIKDFFSGVPAEARTAANTLLTDTKAKLSAAKADVLADVKAKFSAPAALPAVKAVAAAPVVQAAAPVEVALPQAAPPHA